MAIVPLAVIAPPESPVPAVMLVTVPPAVLLIGVLLSAVTRPLASTLITGTAVPLPMLLCAVVIACRVGLGYVLPAKSPPAAPVRHTRPKDDPLEKIDLISATDLNTVVDTAITVGGLPEDWKEKVIEHYKVVTFEDLNEKQYQNIIKSLKEKGIAVS
jgi:hypothetical protein